jgi:glycosyltransferase involved in cell wall biosynthesis
LIETVQNSPGSPWVSVIVPFYETPPEIFEETIRSVLDQTTSRWELILCNDGSHGGCVAVARRYAAMHPEQIRLVEHEDKRNRGHSATRNLGLSRATGEYVLFLDSDDVLLPTKLLEQATLLDENPAAGAAYGRTVYWSSWADTNSRQQRDWSPPLGLPVGRIISPPDALPGLLSGRAPPPPPCSVMARREVVRKVGAFEEEFRRLYEDQVFLVKLCVTTPIIVADRIWDRYRQREDSLSAQASAQQNCEARLIFLDWVRAHTSEYGIFEGQIEQIYDREVWKLHHPRAARLMRFREKLWARLWAR